MLKLWQKTLLYPGSSYTGSESDCGSSQFADAGKDSENISLEQMMRYLAIKISVPSN